MTEQRKKRVGDGPWVRLDVKIALAVVKPDVSPGPFLYLHGLMIEATQLFAMGLANAMEDLTEDLVNDKLGRISLDLMGVLTARAISLGFNNMGSIPEGMYMLDDVAKTKLDVSNETHEMVVDTESGEYQYLGKSKPKETMH